MVDLAINSYYSDAGTEAVNKLTWQKDLIHIAKNCLNDRVAQAAIERVSDFNSLVDIAKNAEYIFAQNTAVKEIIDQDALFDLATNLTNIESRCIAISRLNSKEKLESFINPDEFTEIGKPNVTSTPLHKKIALLKLILIDPVVKNYYYYLELEIEIIEKFYSTTTPYYVYLNEVDVKITDKAPPQNIILKESYLPIESGHAVFYSRDIKLDEYTSLDITEICKEILKPFNENELKDIISTSGYYNLREAALMNLDKKQNQEYFTKIAKTDKHENVRIRALQIIDNKQWQDLYSDVAKSDKHEDVRIEALKNLAKKPALLFTDYNFPGFGERV